MSLILVSAACGDKAATPDPIARSNNSVVVPASPVAAAIALGMTPVSVDEHGIPRLMRATHAPLLPGATATDIAIAHAQRLAPAYGARAPKLVGIGEIAMPNGTIVRLRQIIDGLPVDRSELHLFVTAYGGLIAASGSMVSADIPRVAAKFIDDDAGAIARAVGASYKTAFDAHALVTKRKATQGSRIVAGHDGAINVSMAMATQVWSRVGGQLVAAWSIDTYAGQTKTTDSDAFHTVIAGASGRVLAQRSITANDAFSYRVYANAAGEVHPFDGPIVDPTPNTGGLTTPYPAFITSNLVSVAGLNHLNDPWLPAGATDTNGNSVDAYADLSAPNGFSAGDFRASTSGPNAFDRTYDLDAEPESSQNQQMAAITQVFFTMNWLHDFWYDNGFTEVAGNAQADNYGRGGVDGDPMLAEAEDYSGTNNSNMSTPADGMSPRMQAYLWTGFTTLAISEAGHTPAAGTAVFGPQNFNLTATATITSPTTGCTALAVPVTGQIAVIDRGGCTFKTKTLNAQNAGAVGVIIANTAAGTIAMGDDATITTPITIPTLSISMVDGATFKTDIGAGTVNASMFRATGVQHDGDLDASVIAHEFGHYVHHRLSDCGAQLCSGMSEGWADFDALMMVLRPGDNLDGVYPLAVYDSASFANAAYFGIRRAPYSVDQTVNAISFRHMTNGVALPTGQPFLTLGPNSEVHNTGEVWAATVWEAYIALQKQSTYATARAKMAKYIVASMLMTPTDTTPTEARDAMLSVTQTTADFSTIALAFARRGEGSCAVSPARDSTDNSGIVESSEVKGSIQAGTPSLSDDVVTCDHDGILDGGEKGHLTIPVANIGGAAMTNLVITVTSTTPGVTVTSSPITLASFDLGETKMVTADVSLDDTISDVVEGDFSISMTADDACAPVTTTLSVPLNVDNVANASATDTFDATTSVWTASDSNWTHVRLTGLDGNWHGDDQGSVSDVQLTSPALKANATTPVTVSFVHTYDFEPGFDGGVIEYSIDNGTTWADVATLTGVTPGYSGTLDANSGGPLATRMAYTGTNPSTPATDTVTLDFGTQLAGQTFLLRFRIGSDEATGATGWTIDNVSITGIDNTPFPTEVADQGTCTGPSGPDAGAGADAGSEPAVPISGGCCDAGPMHAQNVLLVLGVVALLRRSRRKSA